MSGDTIFWWKWRAPTSERWPRSYPRSCPRSGVLSTATHFVLRAKEQGVLMSGSAPDERLVVAPDTP